MAGVNRCWNILIGGRACALARRTKHLAVPNAFMSSIFYDYAVVAQLVEQRSCKPPVIGSIPVSSVSCLHRPVVRTPGFQPGNMGSTPIGDRGLDNDRKRNCHGNLAGTP